MREEIYPLTYNLEREYWWYAGRRKIILSCVQEILHSTSGSERPHILDYGCGTGINLLHFSELGEAYGVDASPQALAFCRERGLHRLAQIDRLPPSPAPFDRKFDLITVLDVLEHLTTIIRLNWAICWRPGNFRIMPAYEFYGAELRF
jgi:SAM-dependent methyltransferase